MNLYVDIGNSRIRLARQTDAGAAYHYDLATFDTVLADECKEMEVPDRIIVANVAGEKVAAAFTRLCEKLWSRRPEFIRVSGEAFGVRNAYAAFERLGVDRWLAMIAGWNKYRDRICIFDCGSAVTADVVAADGRHRGGYLIPGAYMMRQALVENTAGINITGNPACTGEPGRSTEECIYNGTVLAVAGFIEKVMQSLNGADGGYQCVMTGGAAEDIMKFMSIPCRHEPLLVIEGIKMAATQTTGTSTQTTGTSGD